VPESTLSTALLSAWAVFWLVWLLWALGAKSGRRSGRARSPGLLVVAVVIAASRLLHGRGPVIGGLPAELAGVAMFAAGLGLAISARAYLGGNWGMPMSRKDEPELVTTGPYRFVRHPIYSGVVLAMIGTALASYLYWLLVALALGAYFLYCAGVEEQILAETFPASYPGYRARTKRLIPFLL
jgi:protein-S-isoprenylcysteine O-methyltransferase Ste14